MELVWVLHSVLEPVWTQASLMDLVMESQSAWEFQPEADPPWAEVPMLPSGLRTPVLLGPSVRESGWGFVSAQEYLSVTVCCPLLSLRTFP